MLEYLMGALDVDRGHTLMIGDTTHDLEMAQNAAVASVAAAYGAHPREALLRHAPVACVSEFAELREWLHLHA
jgi:phosphoglycolate phosphatase